MEDGLAPHVTLEEIIHVNALLLSSGLAIDAMNTVRRHLSAVKGGRLGALAPPGSMTLVYSDVPPGRPEIVGSGPTAHDPTTLAEAAAILRSLDDDLADRLASRLETGRVPETVREPPTGLEVIADSDAMVAAAVAECRSRGLEVSVGPSLDGAVENVAQRLAAEVSRLERGEVLVSAGEATVEVRGGGRGGRCSELAARFVLACDVAGEHTSCGVFGSSDGRDGTSPAAAVVVRPSSTRRLEPERASEALGRSASYELVTGLGEPIIMMPTGNNLRDIALIARER
jgi:hydroxypyruvate reductase